LIDAFWMVMYYWGAVSRVMNTQRLVVKAVFIIKCWQELKEAELI
jgi:hypothetical protein